MAHYGRSFDTFWGEGTPAEPPPVFFCCTVAMNINQCFLYVPRSPSLLSVIFLGPKCDGRMSKFHDLKDCTRGYICNGRAPHSICLSKIYINYHLIIR